MPFPLLPTLSRAVRRRLLAALLLIGTPLVLTAQTSQGGQPAPEPPRLTDTVSEELAKLQPLADAENWDAALAIIVAASNGITPGSYDEAVLTQLRAQFLLQKGSYRESIPYLERTLELGRAHGYFQPHALLEYTYYLAQLYFQEAGHEAVVARGIAAQREIMDKGLRYIREYLDQAPKPTQDHQNFFASVLFARAQIDPNNIDKALLTEAYEAAQHGLRMSLNPNNRFYVLSLAALQILERIPESAEVLEQLVKIEPTNATYWQQLAATYLNMAGSTEDDRRAFEYQVRSIVTIKRAQALGLMSEPRDNYNLVGIYFNIQHFDQAIEILERGLRNGGIENIQRNWELLASSYQQLNRDFKAIEALKEGATQFPEAGQLEFQIANIYYALNNLPESLSHAQAALRKGNLTRISQVQSFAAYVAFELRQYDLALQLAEEAAKDPEAREAERLLGHIRTTIAERDAALLAE